jgi:5,10-methylene-tetrahydrofolate dehydrogenase/methenyl tetrahydrofolate cyclohydrolase
MPINRQFSARLDTTQLSANRQVTGILLQLPLAVHVNARRLIALIHPGKDVDGLTAESTAAWRWTSRGYGPARRRP